MTPQIFFLNGSSSAGKTSLAHVLQAKLPGVWLHVGVDHFFQMAPLKIHGTPEGIQLTPLADGRIEVRIGPHGQRVIGAFHDAVRGIANGGTGVIIDDVLFDPAQLDRWARDLAGLDVFFVGVHCALEELQRREIARGDRGVGQALAQHVIVHAHGRYDFTVDTTATMTDACADAIIAAVNTRAASSVFAQRAAAQA